MCIGDNILRNKKLYTHVNHEIKNLIMKQIVKVTITFYIESCLCSPSKRSSLQCASSNVKCNTPPFILRPNNYELKNRAPFMLNWKHSQTWITFTCLQTLILQNIKLINSKMANELVEITLINKNDIKISK